MRAEFLWEVFTETGAPEAYLLFKDAWIDLLTQDHPQYLFNLQGDRSQQQAGNKQNDQQQGQQNKTEYRSVFHAEMSISI